VVQWRALNLTSGTKVHLAVRTPDGSATVCGATRADTRRSWTLTHAEADCALCHRSLEAARPRFGPPKRQRHTGYAAFIETNWRAQDNEYTYIVTETRQLDGTVLEARLHIYERDGRQVLRLVPLRTNGEAALAAAMWAAAHRRRRRETLHWHEEAAATGRQWTAKDTAGRTYTVTEDSRRRVAVQASKGRKRLWYWTYDNVGAAKRACMLHTASEE